MTPNSTKYTTKYVLGLDKNSCVNNILVNIRVAIPEGRDVVCKTITFFQFDSDAAFQFNFIENVRR